MVSQCFTADHGGTRTYHDFAFTQMPLLLYLYGLVLELGGSEMYLGRVFSAVCSMASMAWG
ncbi:MAG: hypothetical protein U5K31_02890 [Balneolaceae bacterium]|nr:hypothetical protein [Balneolaceae bacterium]